MKNDLFMRKRLSRIYSFQMFFVVTFFVLSCGLASCLDEAEEKVEIDNSAPAQVSDVQAVAGPGEVNLSWSIPASKSFMYTKVEYTDVKGNNLGPVEMEATPGAPAFIAVAQSVSIEPDEGGALVNYSNEFSVSAFIELDYHATSDASKSGMVSIEAPANTTGSQWVRFSSADSFIAGEECIVSIKGKDLVGNTSESRQVTVTPVPVDKVSRTDWSFPGYDDNSDSQTNGYSSQETKGEGGTPNGRVIAMIDGNVNTFWHATWKSKGTTYPHWFILDMGKNVKVSSVELLRRQGKNGAKCQTGQQFYVCAEENAKDPANPDNWEWEDQGAYSFNASLETPQAYRMKGTPSVRYIKVYFGEKYKGVGDQAMLAEINVYTVK